MRSPPGGSGSLGPRKLLGTGRGGLSGLGEAQVEVQFGSLPAKFTCTGENLYVTEVSSLQTQVPNCGTKMQLTVYVSLSI